jgi:hypothetical protein
MHEAIVQWKIVVVLSISLFRVFLMTTPWEDWAEEWTQPWEDWYSRHPAQPPVLNRIQFCLCLVIQREFIVSLIQDLGADFRVAVQFLLPHHNRVRLRPLRDILRENKIIRILGIPRTKEDWTEIIRWGRRTLPHGRFQTSEIRSPLFRPR